jgi:prepilin-type processing-associated H-X9-DG protein
MTSPRVALLLALVSPIASAQVPHEEDIVLHTGSDLLEWCQRESQLQLIGEGHTPANWRARHYERVNTLFVDGAWRVDGTEIIVECRVGRGARDDFATIEIKPR